MTGTSTILAMSNDGLTITVDDGSVLATGNVFVDVQPQEPLFDGKYLEENVRMSLPSTSDSYGISPDEKPIIGGKYATVTWRALDTNEAGVDNRYVRHRGLGGTRGELLGDREARFTIYFLEGSDAMAASAGGDENNAELLLAFLKPSGTGVMKLANGSTTTDIPTWLA
jgi:hypothetical protein